MSTKAKWHWPQFTLRVLFAAVTLLCVWLAVQVNRARNQREAVEAITKAGGRVYFDYQTTDKSVDSEAKPRTPAWLRRLVGDDLFRNVVVVNLEDLAHTDETLQWLRYLPTVEELTIDNEPMDPEDGYYQGWLSPQVKLRGEPTTERGLACLEHLPRLRRLRLAGAQISDDGVRHISGLHNLKVLGIGGTAITDRALIHLRGLQNLEGLDLRQTRVGDDGLIHLQSLPALIGLAVNRTRVTDAGLKHIGKLTSLKALGIGENDVSDEGLAYLRNLSQLQGLTINDTRITDAGMEHLRGFTELEELYVQVTRVGDAGVACLRDLEKLHHVDVRGTQITDDGLTELSRMSNLQQIWINTKPLSPIDFASETRFARFGEVVQPRTTPEGIMKLQQALPACRISDN